MNNITTNGHAAETCPTCAKSTTNSSSKQVEPTLGAEIMKEVKRYDDGNGCTRRQLVDAILILVDQHTRVPADNVSSTVSIPSGEWRQVHIKAGNPRVVAVEFETEEQATAFITSFTTANP